MTTLAIRLTGRPILKNKESWRRCARGRDYLRFSPGVDLVADTRKSSLRLGLDFCEYRLKRVLTLALFQDISDERRPGGIPRTLEVGKLSDGVQDRTLDPFPLSWRNARNVFRPPQYRGQDWCSCSQRFLTETR